ncbi:Recombination protein RecR [hydrothermal vent metagenome]|uniref:Recombination protein RecR n=1 Tax=hydrothermal vent metagenome TaxID=652676 RepID=A0A3B1BYM4_9ZZZZ
MKGPESLSVLIERLTTLPGVGRKTAERLAFFILKSSAEEAGKLTQAITAVKEKVKLCSVCMSTTEQDPCSICADQRRDHGTICVVEEPHDVFAIERTSEFKGVYHVLMGVLSPLDGVGPDELKIDDLVERAGRDGVKEVIVATNPSAEGEATAMYIGKLLADKGVLVTRIARGLPMGGDLEYADEVTLSKAMSGRLKI